MEYKNLNIRMPVEVFAAFKDEHARTFAEHRKSFNAWIIERIQRAIAAQL
jgi:predicted HicB family RNase H-like nuclease